MTSRIRCACSAFIALVACGPAHADWQFTRWGMSPEQVISAGNGLSRTSPEETKKNELVGVDGVPLVKGPYRAAHIDFTAWFYFRNGALNGVRLVIPTPRQASLALSRLQQRYGKPERTGKTGFNDCKITNAEWVSDKENVRVSYSSMICESGMGNNVIVYEPAQKPDNNGL